MKLKTTFIAVALLLSATSTQAALVETDWTNTGDALATLDTDTGIEWLDLTQTLGMSINQAEGLIASGGAFDGWRLPTKSEVNQMMVNAFPSFYGNIDRYMTSVSADNDADQFRAMFGATGVFSVYDTTRGIFKNDPDGNYSILKTIVDDTRSTDYVQLHSGSNFSNDYNFSRSTAGVYLVSDGGTTLSSQLDPSLNINNDNAPINDVYAPSLLGLMSLGLLGFSARRRSSNTSKHSK